ncbi:MAG TPA: CvpA family protein [Blastocatellia bacterium]|nr:CvpA family protein [Blastocatellia bacterium]
MTALDYFVLTVTLVSVSFGAMKGILKSVISVTFAVAGLISAAYLYQYLSRLVRVFVSSEQTAHLVSFAAVFLLVVISGAVFSAWLHRKLKTARLSWINHGLGAGFGLLRGWLLCSAIYLALTAFPVRIEAVERAALAPALIEGTRLIAYMTSPEMRERFLKGYDAVKQSWSPGG